MTRVFTIVLVVVLLAVSGLGADTYLVFEQYGGHWSDVEKSPLTTDDDLLCWAAAASNALAYSGWGIVGGMVNADEMFDHFTSHWTNKGGYMSFAWEWWFTGINPRQGYSAYAQVDVEGGGGFYLDDTFSDYYQTEWYLESTMFSIDAFLREGSTVTIAVQGTMAHGVTVWGFDYDLTGYQGIWLTDSDDDKGLTDPPDVLAYYDVVYDETSERWYIQDYYGTNANYIGQVQSLKSGYVLGDFNGDRTVNSLDIPGMKLALFDLGAWEEATGRNILLTGDFNGDRVFNALDVQGFKANAQSFGNVPEPSALLVVGALLVLRWGRQWKHLN